MDHNSMLDALLPTPPAMGVISPRPVAMIDPLYGRIEPGLGDELITRLLQTRPMARLRDNSLSSVPAEMLPTGQPSSRFEHSVGVAHLANELCKQPTFAPWRDQLMVAALFHDSGSIAFSHLAEIFLHEVTGQTHEQAAVDALADEDVALILSEHNVDPAMVLALINGCHPELGGILAGTIDLDNLDNSARLLRALGGAKEPQYSPLKLLKAFRLKSGTLSFDSRYLKDLAGWVECRDMLYTDVLYVDDRVSAGTMLYRAIEMAYTKGLIDERFFQLGEGAALAYLRSSCMPLPVRQIIERACCWQFYDRVHHIHAEDEDTRRRLLRLADDWRARKDFADQLAKSIGAYPSLVTIQAGRDKGVKKVDLPFIGKYAASCAGLFDQPPAGYSLQVFLAPDCREGAGAAAAQACAELLAQVEGIEAGKSFM